MPAAIFSQSCTIARCYATNSCYRHRRLARSLRDRLGNAKGFSFWSMATSVRAIGLHTARVRHYIRHQEVRDRQQEEFDLDG